MKRVHWFGGLIASSCLFVAGCGGSDTGPGQGGGGATATTSTGAATGKSSSAATGTSSSSSSSSSSAATGTSSSTGSGPLACDAHPNDGQQIPETAGVGAMPTAAGGTIVDGTYHLTNWDIYPTGTIDAYLREETWIIANGTLQAVSQRDTDPEKRNAGTFTTAGTTFTLNLTCPQTATLMTEYTATPTTISFLQTSVTGNEVHTYTKQ